MDETKSLRLDLRISPQQRRRIDVLKNKTKARSTTSVIANALAVYDHLWKVKGQKATILIRTADGEELELDLQ